MRANGARPPTCFNLLDVILAFKCEIMHRTLACIFFLMHILGMNVFNKLTFLINVFDQLKRTLVSF